MGKLIGISIGLVALAGLGACGEDTGKRLAAPELACLDRVEGAIGTIGSSDFDDPTRARETFARVANVMDSVDLSGCSAQSRANFQAARGSITRAQDLIAEFDRYGGSPDRQNRMLAAMDTFESSMSAMGEERLSRQAEFDSQ